MSKDTCKGAQHQYSLGKYISKPQWDITSHLLEWLLSKRQEIESIGKDVVKKKHLYIVGGKVNWWILYGKHYGYSSKN